MGEGRLSDTGVRNVSCGLSLVEGEPKGRCWALGNGLLALRQARKKDLGKARSGEGGFHVAGRPFVSAQLGSHAAGGTSGHWERDGLARARDPKMIFI